MLGAPEMNARSARIVFDSRKQERPHVSFITVNWHSADAVRQLLPSIVQCVTVKHETIVVNNDWTEQEELLRTCEGHADVALVEAGSNIGFAAGCNRGVEVSRGKHLIFVNPDVRFRRFPAHVLEEIDRRYGRRAVYGTILQHRGMPGRGSLRRFPTGCRVLVDSAGLDRVVPAWQDRGLFYRDEAAMPGYSAVEQPIGAFFGVTRDVFEELGGFDERFFVFFEEVDLALRATDAAVPVVVVPDLVVEHEGGHSTRGDHTTTIGLRWRSLRAFHQKHARRLRLPPWFVVVGLEAMRFTVQSLLHRGRPFSLRGALVIAFGARRNRS